MRVGGGDEPPAPRQMLAGPQGAADVEGGPQSQPASSRVVEYSGLAPLPTSRPTARAACRCRRIGCSRRSSPAARAGQQEPDVFFVQGGRSVAEVHLQEISSLTPSRSPAHLKRGESPPSHSFSHFLTLSHLLARVEGSGGRQAREALRLVVSSREVGSLLLGLKLGLKCGHLLLVLRHSIAVA